MDSPRLQLVADTEGSDVEHGRAQPRRGWRAVAAISLSLAVGLMVVAYQRIPGAVTIDVGDGPMQVKEDLTKPVWFCKRDKDAKSHYPTCDDLNYHAICCKPDEALSSVSKHKSVHDTRCLDGKQGHVDEAQCPQPKPDELTLEDKADKDPLAKMKYSCEYRVNYGGADLPGNPRTVSNNPDDTEGTSTKTKLGLKECGEKCRDTAPCKIFTYNNKGECWLKKADGAKRQTWWLGKIAQEHPGFGFFKKKMQIFTTSCVHSGVIISDP